MHWIIINFDILFFGAHIHRCSVGWNGVLWGSRISISKNSLVFEWWYVLKNSFYTYVIRFHTFFTCRMYCASIFTQSIQNIRVINFRSMYVPTKLLLCLQKRAFHSSFDQSYDSTYSYRVRHVFYEYILKCFLREMSTYRSNDV